MFDQEVVCKTCGGYIWPLACDGEKYATNRCKCDGLQNAIDLRSFGYDHYVPDVRIAGGPLFMRRPDGTTIRQDQFGEEIEALLRS